MRVGPVRSRIVRSRIGRRLPTLAVLILAVAGAGLAGWRVIGSAGGWDGRVASIVSFVQDDRGLTFTHPVPVEFLSPSRFRVALGEGPPTSASDRAAVQQEVSELRALGLAHGAVDLGALEARANQAETVGFYDTDTKRLYVEGTSLSPYVRGTLAHELTHALQDQRLGLGRLDGLPDDQQPAVSALVEGDAVLVENDYDSHFSQSEEAAYQAEQDSLGGGPTSGLPEAVSDSDSFPYDFGPAFVDAVFAVGGNSAIDAAFRNPPTSEAEIVNPSRYLGHVRTATVPRPHLPAGARVLQPAAAFGQVSMAEALGARIGWSAWAAVQGWSGDSSVLYALDGRTCVAIDTLLDSPGSADAFRAGAQEWARGLPGAAVTGSGTTVSIRSCDPGSAAVVATPPSPTVHDVLVARANLIQDLLNGDAGSALQAECTADGTISALGAARAVAYDQSAPGAPTDNQVHALERTAERRC